MSSQDPIKIRLELTRGHWALGEHDDAVACLERLFEAEPEADGLADLIDVLLAETEGAADVTPAVASRLASLRRELPCEATVLPEPGSPLATATMARLLVDQGHAGHAVAVAEEVLRGNPNSPDARQILERAQVDDTRLRAIERLESWLAQLRHHGRREAQA